MVRQLERDLPELLAFFNFPRHLWKKLRTTNIIERCFVEVRRRTRPMVCFVNVKSVDRIIYSIFQRFNLEWKTRTLPGSVSLSHFRCGKPSCHCAQEEGHPAWSFTYMVNGKKRVQHIPKELIPEIQQRVAAGREYQEAVRAVLAANAQLWVGAEAETPAVRRPTPPHRLLPYVRQGLRLKR